jgi:ribosome biogenesis GTPase
MKNKKHQHRKPAKLLGNEREGLLVTTFGANAELEDEHGTIIRCHIRKNADPVITGDRVYWLPEKDGTATIVGPMPRKSLLCRPENPHTLKLIAANIDVIIIVTAPPPVLSEDMIDRYLVAAELLKIKPIILLNKIDLLDPQHKDELMQRLAPYHEIGYDVIYSSTYTRDGLAELDKFLHEKTCVLVGASGVGKSSIISALTAQSIRVGEVSVSTGLGKHTTTTTHLYHLPQGGKLIDSPGVREFGLWHVNEEELFQGFIEFKPFLKQCKYRNCQHKIEPECAIQDAVATKKIDARRFQSYCKILAGLSARRR